MRRILVSHARAKGRLKRGGGWRRIDLEEADLTEAVADGGLTDLSDVLTALAAEDPESAAVVELRYFAGAMWAEVAAALNQSVDDAKEHWAYAKAWLYHRLARAGPSGG
jgi:RNA polymerase sigma factor (TIGR02999 family)